MYAIFEQGSHQFRVREGDVITLDHLQGDAGSEIVFDRVLLVAGGDGEPQLGLPLLAGAKVTAQILEQYRGKKILIRKYKRRKGYRRRRGFRATLTDVRITGVSLG